MRCDRSFAIALVALTTYAVPQALVAQRGRGGGAGTGGMGHSTTSSGPDVTRGSGGRSGVPGGLGPGDGASSVKRLENDPALATRIQPLLPPGSTVSSAAAGFHNTGEFIAALQVSRNLGIPFDQLKSQMTEGNGRSLGNAIRNLRPDLDKETVKESVKTARREADQEMRAARAGRVESGAAAEIRSNPGLSTRLAPLLPAGMTFDQASAGFRNTGQFVAALHVARNLNIPFTELRARMIAGGESLGEAIHGLRPEMPDAEIRASVSGATRAAENDLQFGEKPGAPPPVRQ